MAHIQDRWERTVDGERVRTTHYGRGKRWHARYRDPDCHERTKDFARKADAERFLATITADVLRGAFQLRPDPVGTPSEHDEPSEEPLMGDHSAIEWTEATWNPTTGCDKTSPGCDNCYALTLAKRVKAMGQAKYQRDGDPRTSGPGFGLTIHPDALDIPRSWSAPRTIFVNSMSDLFHPEVPRLGPLVERCLDTGPPARDG